MASSILDSIIGGTDKVSVGTVIGMEKRQISKKPRKGKWVVVGDALNRPPDCCSQRYRDTLIKRSQKTF